MFDQPDYSGVPHPSCDEIPEPEAPACRSCGEEPAAVRFEFSVPAPARFELCTGCLLKAAFVLLQIDPGSVVEPVPGGPRTSVEAA